MNRKYNLSQAIEEEKVWNDRKNINFDYDLSIVITLERLKSLLKRGLINEYQFQEFKSLLIGILDDDGIFKTSNDVDFIEYLGYDPKISYEVLIKRIEKDKPEGIEVVDNKIYRLGINYPVKNSNQYYFQVLLINLADLSSLQLDKFLDYHYYNYENKTTFLWLLKGLVRDYQVSFFPIGNAASVIEWINLRRPNNKGNKRNKPTEVILTLENIFYHESDLAAICKELAKEKVPKTGKPFINIIQQETLGKGQPIKVYSWISYDNYLAVLCHHLLKSKTMYIKTKYRNRNARFFAEKFSKYFNLELDDSLLKYFQDEQRKNLYIKYQDLFSFIT